MLSETPSDNRFLIVDNHHFGRDTLRRNLLSMGANEVDVATNATKALSMCKNNAYGMVLADYDLGEGKNGQQLLEELRGNKILGNVSAFIILTSATNRDVVLSTLEYQPDDYLAKPYIESVLNSRITRMLRYKTHLHHVFQAIDEENFTAAVKNCERYVEKNDQFVNSCLRILAELYFSRKDYGKAEAIYQKDINSNKSDWAKLGLAKLYLKNNKLPEAEELFLEIIDANYMYVEAYEYLSKIYLKNDSTIKAEKIMAKGVQVSPLSIVRQQSYAGLCENNNNHNDAIKARR